MKLPGQLLVVSESGLLQLAVDEQLFFLVGQGSDLTIRVPLSFHCCDRISIDTKY
jgi:hypothetical protein